MPTANEILRDSEVGHQVGLQRLSNGIVRRIIALLNRLDADLFSQITTALDRLPAESFTVDRLEGLLSSVRTLNAQAYDAVKRDLPAQLRDVTEYEAGFQFRLFESAIPAQVVAQAGVNAVNASQVYAAALSRPFQGRLLSEWMQGLESDRAARVRDAIRIGYSEGQTVGQMVTRLRGTRAKGYEDGIIQIDRRNAEAVVRTAVSHTAATVKDAFYAANKDLVKAVQWVSTLDARTTPQCQVRDGLTYTTAHKPIDHSVPWLAGPGKLHWNAIQAGSLVLTARGGVPIEDVTRGEMVLTHRGRFQPVLDLRRKVNESGVLRVVRMKSGRVLRATDDHPVLSAGDGWKFVGALKVGDKLLRKTDGPGEVAGVLGVVAPEPQDCPSAPDSTDVSIRRTLMLCAAAMGLKSNPDVRPCEVEDRAILLVLSDPSIVKDECRKHHLHSVANALQQFGRHRFSDLLSDLIGDCGAKHPAAISGVSAACDVRGDYPVHDARHLGRVVSGHSFGVGGHGRVGSLAKPKGPMFVAGRPNPMSEPEVRFSLLGSGPDADSVFLGEVRQASVRQPVRALNVSERPSFDVMFLRDAPKMGRISFSHDEVVSLELQNYKYHVFDLEVQCDASYVASGVVVSNCRSSSTPVLKSYRELGIPIDEISASTRASMDGEVPAETTYSEWIAKQSAARQDEVLGPTRGKLFRQGDLAIDRFTNDKGVFLTLDELRERDAKAFERAGL